MRIGYACINVALSGTGVQINRSMIKRTFAEKGIEYASQLALQNIRDLEKIIDWNIANKIFLYRMSSDMIPWMSEYELTDLPGYAAISKILSRCGEKAKSAGLRLTYHPGPFNVLASRSEDVIRKTLKELRQHGEIMDMMKLPRDQFAKINIHVGGAYGDKITALERFAENFLLLADTARLRLTVENDDKANMFSVKDLLWLHQRVTIPVVFDYLHHKFCTGGLSEQDAFMAAYETWPKGITPIVHFSSEKKKFEDPAAVATAHADFIYQAIDRYGKDVDIMLEAKAKDEAVKKYMKDYRVKL